MHIEMGAWQTPSHSSHVTVCAGDIGLARNLPQIKRYFDSIKETTDNVIWVPGNHEFYDHDYPVALEEMGEFAIKEGIHLLDETLGTQDLVIDGVTFWGSTLWTDLKEEDWVVMQKIGHGMNDFYVIGNSDKGEGAGFSAQDSVAINKRTREKINWDADVIITHHHPLLREHSRFPMSDITYGFCNTGLEQLIYDSKVKLWLFGHTHDSTYEELNGTRIVSNQQGYPRKDWHTGDIIYEESGFDPGLILTI
jgi:predicted phosphohydrolase